MADWTSVSLGQLPSPELAEIRPVALSRIRPVALKGGNLGCAMVRAWRGRSWGDLRPGTFKPEIILLYRMPIAAVWDWPAAPAERLWGIPDLQPDKVVVG